MESLSLARFTDFLDWLDVTYDRYIGGILVLCLIIVTVACIAILIHLAFADDNEADIGLCARGYSHFCHETQLQHDLRAKLMIWNALNCSTRDICTANNNNTDFKVVNSNNITVCFDDRKMYNEYTNSSSQKEFPATWKCPPRPNFSQDESNK